MKLSVVIPAAFCVAAGVLLSGNAALEYLNGAKSEFDLFSFSVGLYFVGKGLFVHGMLSSLAPQARS